MSSSRDFRFTVEQIWLLQRLRGSGLTRDQIVAGLEDLDRLDGAGNAPSAFGGSQMSTPASNARPLSTGSEHAKSPTEATEAEKVCSTQPPNISSNAIPATFSHNAQSTLHKNLSQAAAALLQNQKSNLPIQPFSMWANRVNPSVNPYAALSNSFNNGINEEKSAENGFRKLDEPDDLADEIDQIQRAVEHCERRNQHEVKEEIRIFTQRHHISQTAISKATHQAISQSYISQWLTSNITMGDAKRRIIYEWFVRQKRRLEGIYPGHLASVPTKAIVSSSNSLSSLPSSLTNRLMNHLPAASGNVISALSHQMERSSPGIISPLPNRKPRQRIMWPLRCLQFLDGAFARNPYPGAAERAQLVIECNNLLGDDRSVDINEAHVANWFRNRRKMKKVIDQSGNKSMEQFEELIEMQEGHEVMEHEEKNTNQPITEVVDVEDDEDDRVKTEPKDEISDSPRQLRIDEVRSNSPLEDSSPSADSRKSPISSDPTSTYANSQTSGVLKSALLTNSQMDHDGRLSNASIMQRIMNTTPPQLTPAPSHLLHSSLMQVNRSKLIQNMNVNSGLEA
jgi:hypothetical protein